MNIIKGKKLIVDANANSQISIQQPTQHWESNINTKTVILARKIRYVYYELSTSNSDDNMIEGHTIKIKSSYILQTR